MLKIDSGADEIIKILQSHGFAGHIVGGCVRDMILGIKPKDWDITTNARPHEVKQLFPMTVDTGIKHGTMTVVLNGENYEVTTYRVDGKYRDNRRPDVVTFTSSLKEDLSRRDFTINALAYNHDQGFIDYCNGQTDIINRVLRTVGEPEERFSEDALRMLRAIRFAGTYNLSIERKTYSAIQKRCELIVNISPDRIRNELNKILISANPSKGISLLNDTGLLHYILPEVEYMVDFDQRNPHHHKDVFQHTLIVLENVPNSLVLRWAALLHDIAKPLTFTEDKCGIGHFYGHHVLGENMAEEVLRRLKFDNDTVYKVCKLVREHMSRYAPLKKVSIKKLINRIGVENLDALFLLQIADIKGSAPPHNLTKVLKLQAEVKGILNEKEPLTVRDLAINGRDLINVGIKPSREMGQILGQLLEKVLEKPELNYRAKLLEIAKSIDQGVRRDDFAAE